jgi:hypothetical protein
MSKKHLLSLSILFLIFFIFLSSNFALAQDGLIPSPSRGGEGNYSLNDFITVAVRISQLILGLVGSLSLIMFIYGGIMFMISSGSSEKINQAKNIIVAAAVGLIIVFSSWLIIKFVVSSLGATGKYQFDGNIKIISLKD